MNIVLASSNKGKIKEIKAFLNGWSIKGFDEVTTPFEIEENGTSFSQNALIKSKTLYDFLQDENTIVLSDDSGISLPILGGQPGIYSARYAGKNADAKANTAKLVQTLKSMGIKKTPAFYTACIAVSSKWGDFTVHGYMHGYAIDEQRGDKGFGYDPVFIPKGESLTLGELDESYKLKFSHRSKALGLVKKILKTLPKD